jgi:hypothetical protein
MSWECFLSLIEIVKTPMIIWEIFWRTIEKFAWLATIAIPIVLFLLNRHNEKQVKNRQNQETARKFILDNIEEMGFLPLCIIASHTNSKKRHSQKIYNRFNRLSSEIQKEVLKQENISFTLPDNNDRIDKCIDLMCIDMRKYKLSNSKDMYLYEGAKYFHRGIEDHGVEKLGNDITTYFDDMPIKQGNIRKVLNNDIPHSISVYIDEWMRKELKEDHLLKKNAPPPIDWLHRKKLHDNQLFTLYMMQVVRDFSIIMYNRHYKNDSDEVDNIRNDVLRYYEIETDNYYYEDLYYMALLRLYCTYYPQFERTKCKSP